ncbi:hypothetical protein Q4574_01635 [Aliiglaciecola sp. 3_MG-2023]|uniref:hypothetical protein n=1 Tax=Aliiglaciecola sp. 3_MG-2023 TaxID=3062644 RepID=UPI0026E231BB|nr:hypothetical protein [Aliiglaciecola sp. 3_MG-2023]MDO6691961.1 hypothetical protein [Aliiglaciecola sp. 3_MG-2023]
MEKIEKFFENYSETLNQGLISEMGKFSGKPLVIVTDESKKICHSQKDIDEINLDLINGLKAGGIAKYTPKIIQSMRLSESVIFVKVRWTLCDQNGKDVFSCYCSYTLELDEVNLFKILVIVIDDEDKQFNQMMKRHWN